ncbi:hypothetical protein LUX05_15930 [Streptomyces somaliensis]|nr:hypothetical protein [Streptomyces somaliensis]
MEGIPEIVRDVLQPLCRNVLRIGRVADVFPYPQQHYLNSLHHSWMNVAIAATTGADQLTQAVGAITNPRQAEWEAAMKTFCSALWGATSWGGTRHGKQWGQTANSGPGTPHTPTGSQPVLAVLKDTADDIATILREYAEAAVDLNRDVIDEVHRAMLEAAKEVLDDLARPSSPKSLLTGVTSAIGKGAGVILSFDIKAVLNINTAKLNRIVDTYTGILDGLTTRMEALKGPLDEAYLSAPQVRGRRRPRPGLRHARPGGVQGVTGLAEGGLHREVRPQPRRQRILRARPHTRQARRQDRRATGAAPARPAGERPDPGLAVR